VPTIADHSERELIARIRTRLSPPAAWVAVGIGDDAAVIESERNHLEVLTVDALVEGVHFDRAFTPAAAVGHRALAVNLSDLAAMGARPRFALLSMALPPALPTDDFDAIITALADLAASHHVQVIGGNLTRTSGPLVIDVTAGGVVRRRQVLRRAGARSGDELYVTGRVGSAHAGLQALQARAAAPELRDAVHRYLYPEARIRTGLLVARNRAASACMDLSDGLADAVSQVCEASGVGADLTAEHIPIAPEVRQWFEARGLDAVREALHGGDDYELLFAVPRRRRRAFLAASRLAGVPVTRIGVCAEAAGVRVDGRTDLADPSAGFRHFR
jgi:thiamine-monophosphate kinase